MSPPFPPIRAPSPAQEQAQLAASQHPRQQQKQRSPQKLWDLAALRLALKGAARAGLRSPLRSLLFLALFSVAVPLILFHDDSALLRFRDVAIHLASAGYSSRPTPLPPNATRTFVLLSLPASHKSLPYGRGLVDAHGGPLEGSIAQQEAPGKDKGPIDPSFVDPGNSTVPGRATKAAPGSGGEIGGGGKGPGTGVEPLFSVSELSGNETQSHVSSRGDNAPGRRVVPEGETAGAPGTAREPRGGERRETRRSARRGEMLQLETGREAADRCWSRRELPLFLADAPPSEHLKASLDPYEALHRRCTSPKALDALQASIPSPSPAGRGTRWVDRMTSLFAPEKVSECKYVLYVPPPLGLGNNMMALVSVFAWSMLTNRTVLLGSESVLAQLFCSPFMGSSWAIPQRRFDAIIAAVRPVARDFSETWMPSKGRPAAQAAAPEPLPFAWRVRMSSDSPRAHVQFFCPKVQHAQLARAKAVVMVSDEYFLPGLYAVPEFHAELERLFPGRRVFMQLSRVILLPANDVWARVTQFFHAYLAHHDRLVGIQVRVFGAIKSPLQGRVLECAQNIAGALPRVQAFGSAKSTSSAGSNKEPLKAACSNCSGSGIDSTQPHGTEGGEGAESTGIPGPSTGVFVISLKRTYADDLFEKYLLEGVPENWERVAVYSYSHEGQERVGSLDQYKKLLVEMLLLSFSDTLLTSDYSTIGYVAAGISGLAPWSMNIASWWWGHWKTNGRPVCQRVSPEPCFHRPPSFCLQCNGDEKVKSMARWQTCGGDGRKARGRWLHQAASFVGTCEGMGMGLGINGLIPRNQMAGK